MSTSGSTIDYSELWAEAKTIYGTPKLHSITDAAMHCAFVMGLMFMRRLHLPLQENGDPVDLGPKDTTDDDLWSAWVSARNAYNTAMTCHNLAVEARRFAEQGGHSP
ncbi:MAG: hypothetical protein AB7G11_11115 [Phycisphaerales bacterium]